MLTINGRKYAKNDSEFISTLFQADGTAYGYYAKNPNGILLSDMQKQPFVFIVNNSHGEQFAVSCNEESNGKIRYMQSTTRQHDAILGLDNLGYIAGKEYIRSIIEQANNHAK